MDEPEIGTWEALDPDLRQRLKVVADTLDDIVLPDALAARLPDSWTVTMYSWFADEPPENPNTMLCLREEARDFIRSRRI